MDKVVGVSANGAGASVIATASTVGNDGVSDVEGAEVSDAAAEECGITREGGIGDVEVAGVEDAAAIVYGCRIVIQGGIGEGEGATVADAAAGTAR